MPRYMIELLQRYYQCLGYYTKVSTPIPYKKKIRGREVVFYKFLDLIAIRNNEILLIECRNFRKVKKLRDSLKRLCRFFTYVNDALDEILHLQLPNRIVRRIVFVDEEDYKRLSPYTEILGRCGIELQNLSMIVDEIVKCANREASLRETRGEGDIILSIIAFIAKHLHKPG